MSEVIRERKKPNENQIRQRASPVLVPETPETHQHQHGNPGAEEYIGNLKRLLVQIGCTEAPEASPIDYCPSYRETKEESRIMANGVHRQIFVLGQIGNLSSPFEPLHLHRITGRMRRGIVGLEGVTIVSGPALHPEVVAHRANDVQGFVIA